MFSQKSSTRSYPPSLSLLPPRVILDGEEEGEGEEETIGYLLSNLEDDAACIENVLHVLRYTLEDLNTNKRTPQSTQRKALQILCEAEDVGHDLPNLRRRLDEISADLEALGRNDFVRELHKKYAIIDKTLMEADEMRKELGVWADSIYFQANDLEKLLNAAKS